MKRLFYTSLLLLFISALFASAHSTNSDDSEREWLQSLLREQGISITGGDYVFFCTGHHGIIWSLIASDSTAIRFYNGTTRPLIDSTYYSLPDTLSFINDNIRTITWGIDSLSTAAQFLEPDSNATYSPIYCHFYVIKDGKITFSYNAQNDSYAWADSVAFHNKMRSLAYLMFWLAAPSCHPYMHLPCDSLLRK